MKILDVIGDEQILTRLSANLASQLGYELVRIWCETPPSVLPDAVEIHEKPRFSPETSNDLFVATGDAQTRIEEVRTYGQLLINLIHPSAIVDPSARLGVNVFLDAHAYVGMFAEIGDAAVMCSRSTVEHDSALGQGVMLGASATICGHVSVGSRGFVGANAVVSPRTQICEEVLVGAGAVVTKNIAHPGTYIGSPARAM